jgi:hypothetical protein
LQKIGGRDRDRTGDPLLAKQVLSQLSYTPTAETIIHFNAFVRLRHTNSRNRWREANPNPRAFVVLPAMRRDVKCRKEWAQKVGLGFDLPKAEPPSDVV